MKNGALKIMLAGMMALPHMALADDCKVVEYPDHYEAICVGDAQQTVASSTLPEEYLTAIREQAAAAARTAEQEQIAAASRTAEQEQTAAAQTTGQEEVAAAPEIVVSGLNRAYWAQYLNSRQGR
jgi:hypothetical protein